MVECLKVFRHVGFFVHKKGPAMGRGDMRSRKGKISAKSFGKRRPRHHNRKNKGPGNRSVDRSPPAPRDRHRA
ncbi:MAG: 30S ribosomal protein THX [Sedimentisphaerales bacterium]|nr:30S ribosomal protein THX [Sedimentisphaerales bacterium]